MADTQEVAEYGVSAISQAPSISVFVFSFGIVIMLLLYIWRDKEKINDARHKESEKRHNDMEEIIKKLTDLQTDQQIMLARMEARLDGLEK